MLRPVDRKMMDGLSLCHGLFDIILEAVQRLGLHDADAEGFLLQCRLSSHPYDVVNREFVAENDFLVVVDVDHGGQAGIIKAEEIQEGRILTEAVGVVGIVHSDFLVAKEEEDAAAYAFLQGITSLYVSFFREHIQ